MLIGYDSGKKPTNLVATKKPRKAQKKPLVSSTKKLHLKIQESTIHSQAKHQIKIHIKPSASYIYCCIYRGTFKKTKTHDTNQRRF